MSRTGDSTSSLVDELDEWVMSVAEPRVRPLRAKARAYAEEAVRAARSVDRRSEDLIARVKRGMFGLGDARKSSSAMALIRICNEASSAAQEFYKQDWAVVPLSKLEAGLVRLGRTLAESYNTSGRLAAKYFRSEAFSLSGEIEALQSINKQVSQFETRNREMMAAYESIREQTGLIREQLAALALVKNSRAQTGQELRDAESRLKILQEKISQISKTPGMESFDLVEAELRALRKRLLQEEMSRLGVLMERFSTIIQRGEAEQPRLLASVLNRYIERPLTSLAREDDDYPKLKTALEGLLKTADSGKLGVSEKKARKALEKARKVVDGSLKSIQGEARNAFRRRAELLRSESVRSSRTERLSLRTESMGVAGLRKVSMSKLARLDDEFLFGEKQIASRVGRIEKLAEDWFGKKMPEGLKAKLMMANR